MNQYNQDPYTILGVARHASIVVIRQAFRHLALQHHPDKQQQQHTSLSNENHCHQHDHNAAFRDIQAAWELLRDPQQRAKYDQLHQGAPVAINDEISIDDLDVVEDHKEESHNEDDQSEILYKWTCRCGEIITVEESELEHFHVFSCTSCSLHIRIVDT